LIGSKILVSFIDYVLLTIGILSLIASFKGLIMWTLLIQLVNQ